MRSWPRPSRWPAAAVTPAASSPTTSGRPAPSTSRVTSTVATSPAPSALTVALARVADATISPSQRRASSARAAARTRLAVGSAIRPGSAGFSARDAVAGWTPARAATSRIVGRRATKATRRGSAGRRLPGDRLGRVAPPGPVSLGRLAALELLAGLEPGRHRRVRAGHDLVVLDVEQPQPALLAECQADRAAELDELRLAEVRVHPLPEGVVGVQAPRDRLGVGQGGPLALVEAVGGLEVQEVVVLRLLQALAPALLGALVAAVLALHRARDVDAAELLDLVVEDAVVEQVAPAVGEEPERRRHMRAHGRALRARGALAGAALHLGAHRVVHRLERHVADPLLVRHLVLPSSFEVDCQADATRT